MTGRPLIDVLLPDDDGRDTVTTISDIKRRLAEKIADADRRITAAHQQQWPSQHHRDEVINHAKGSQRGYREALDLLAELEQTTS